MFVEHFVMISAGVIGFHYADTVLSENIRNVTLAPSA